VVIEWEETNSGTDGVRTYNRGIHVMRLRWGRATRLLICPDTIGLRATRDRLAAAGNTEALAAPIVECAGSTRTANDQGLTAFRASTRFSVTTAMDSLTFMPKTDIGTILANQTVAVEFYFDF